MKRLHLLLSVFYLLGPVSLHGAIGSATTGDVVIDTRNWTLSVTTPVNGSVSGAGSYLSATNATLTATPSVGYLLGSWFGDASGSINPLTLLMNADKTVGASFVQDTRDPDQDGLSNYQEILVHLTNPNVADTDGDGVNDGQEITDSSNPKVADSDGDGLNDGSEKTRGTDPLLNDTDGDSYSDSYEVQFASDPRSNTSLPTYTLTLTNNGTATGGTFSKAGTLAHDTNATLTATPSPGYLFGSWFGDASGSTSPTILLMNSNKTAGASFVQDTRDPDQDGLSNYQEILVHLTNPNVADTDGDSYSDSYEVQFASDPRSNTSLPTYTLTLTNNGTATGGTFSKAGTLAHDTNATLTATPSPGYLFGSWFGDASGSTNPTILLMNSNKTVGASFVQDTRDPDQDGLSNYQEILVHLTNPNVADTDSDGLNDGQEISDGTKPLVVDSDGDGLSDGWEVGVGRYSIVPGGFTWETARADARNRGGDLASFAAARQWNVALAGFGANAFDAYTGLWLGASDAAAEGSWVWVSGTPVSFQVWASSRPNVTVDNSTDYLEVSGGAGAELGKWYDRSSATVRDGYVLELGYTTNPAVADADQDGLNDSQEQAARTHPGVADTDGDGLSDGEEVNLSGTDPLKSDTGGTGTPDPEKDNDGDGLNNITEIRQFATDPRKADSDGDGLRDDFELGFGRFALVTERLTWSQARAAAVARGGHLGTFTTAVEYERMRSAIGQSALDALDGAWVGASDEVTDGNWQWISSEAAGSFTIPWGVGRPGTIAGNTLDYAEISGGEGAEPWKWYDRSSTTTRSAYIVEYGYPTDPLIADTDGDGILDGPETLAGLLPTVADMDGDGWLDEAEEDFGGDPRKAGRGPMFQCELSRSSGGSQWILRFPAAKGTLHRIQASADLVSWQTLESNISGAGRVIARAYTISSNQPMRYYRVLKD